jgi:hypothetical protein
MRRCMMAHTCSMALAGIATLSMASIVSFAVPASAQSSQCCSMAAAHTHAAAGPGVQHDHAVQGPAPGAVANVDAEVARLLARVDETTGDERMAVMTELIALLVQDRGARPETAAAAAPAGMLMSAACAERQAPVSEAMCATCAEHQTAAAGGHACPMCAEHQAAGGAQMCAMCTEHRSGDGGSMCAMCAAHHAAASDQTAGVPATESCCAGQK